MKFIHNRMRGVSVEGVTLDIGTLKTDVSTLQDTTTANQNAITANQNAITANQNAITANQNAITALEAFVDGAAEIVFSSSLGEIERVVVEGVAELSYEEESATLNLAIPKNSRIVAAQLFVEEALATGDEWDAKFTGGSTESLVTAGAVTAGTKINKLLNIITTATTNIEFVLTGDSPESFSGDALIAVAVYYETFQEET